MCSIEGQVRVVLRPDGQAVSVASHRPVLACRLFEGRPADQVPTLAATLFSLCSQSQRVAAEAALLAAGGVEPTRARYRDWQRRLTLESLREHLTRLLLDWLPLTGRLPAIDWFRAVCHILARLELEVDSAREELTDQLDALDGELAELADWIEAQGLAGLGSSHCEPLPPLDPQWLDGELAADRDGRFVARPCWQDQTFETGPLARQADLPAVAAVVREYGQGLLARLIARQEELWLLADRLDPSDSCQGSIGMATTGQGCGLAWVENARGRLYHRVEVADGRVSHYRVLAPTEWNFHPQGPLAQGLADPVGRLCPQRRARLAVLALDPCVGHRIVVQ